MGETLDDLDPRSVEADIVAAMEGFTEFSLPYEAVVYEDGELDREELAKTEAARVKSEALYGTSVVEREVEGDEEDPERITIRVLDPAEVVEHG